MDTAKLGRDIASVIQQIEAMDLPTVLRQVKCYDELIKRKLLTKKTGRRPPGTDYNTWEKEVREVMTRHGIL